jgi:hypothetical protein
MVLCTELRGFIDQIKSLPPDSKDTALLINVAFPHPKIESLPTLIQSSYGLPVIVFSDQVDRKATARLTSARVKHVIFGSLSGPSLLVRIHQALRELNAEPEEKDAAAASGESRVSGSGTIIIRNKGSELKSATQGSGSQSDDLLAELESFVESPDYKLHELDTPNEGRAGAPSATEEEQPEAESDSIEHSLDPSKPAAKELSDHVTTELIEACAISSLRDVCGSPLTGKSVLLEYKTALLISVRANYLVGTICIASGFSPRISLETPKDFVLRALEQFKTHLTAAGLDLEAMGAVVSELEVPIVAEEAFLKGDFALVSRSGDGEIGIAYLPGLDLLPRKIQMQETHFEISVQDVEPRTSLQFDLYLRLEKNKKFLRYVRAVGYIDVEQKNRLIERRVNSFFVRNQDVELYRRYYIAQRFAKAPGSSEDGGSGESGSSSGAA